MPAKITISYSETPQGNVELEIHFEGKETATPKETAHVMAMRAYLEWACPDVAKLAGARQFVPLPPGKPADS